MSIQVFVRLGLLLVIASPSNVIFQSAPSIYMIYEHNTQAQTFLFSQPEHLLHLRQQFIHLLQRNQNIKHDATCSPPPYHIHESQLQEQQTTKDLHLRIQENEQLIDELHSQICTLGEITVKMIDYINEMQQKRKDQILQYEDQIQNLRGQLEVAIYKNDKFEGDIEVFRERLIQVQSEMEDIEQHELDKQVNQARDLQNQKKIQLLEHQLEKISRQLSVCKIHYSHKEPEFGSLNRIMSSNLSQKLIKIKRMSSVIISNHLIKSEEMEDLQQKIHILQGQNEALRQQIKSLREHCSAYHVQMKDCYHQTNTFYQQDRVQNFSDMAYPPHMHKVTSSFFLTATAKQQSDYAHHQLVSHKSIQKFHTLSSQWSSKSFQHNLIYLNNEDDDKENYHKNCIPQKQTENSLLDSDLNSKTTKPVRAKSFSEVAVNTELQILSYQKGVRESQMQKVYNFKIKPTTLQHHNSNQANAVDFWNKTFSVLANPLFALKKRAVDDRISKALHQAHRRI